jgi:transcriptional regulator with XRE-family HTH domain
MLKDAIRKYRRELDLSQEELAERVGCKRVSIAHYEAGTVTPRLPVLQALARTFAISLDTLLNDHATLGAEATAHAAPISQEMPVDA